MALKKLKKLKKYFQLDESKYFYIADNLGSAKWGLYTLDQRQKEIELARFLNESSAKNKKKMYEKKVINNFFVRELTLEY